jgi:hypothetical protein
MCGVTIRYGKLICTILATALVTDMSGRRHDAWGKEIPEEKRTREFDKLIDSLANRNPQPKIVELDAARWEAIFDKDYDWKEQARVVKAIQRVAEIATPEMWIRLKAHANDSRYCVTFNDQAAVADCFATNWTVGQVCQEIGRVQVKFPVDRATQAIRVGPRTIYLPLTAVPEYPKAGETRMKVPFVDLQIKLCQQAIADLPKVAAAAKKSSRQVNTDPESLKQCRARLEATIEALKKSKTGIFGKFTFPGERFELLDVDHAKKVRERYEQATKHRETKYDKEDTTPSGRSR